MLLQSMTIWRSVMLNSTAHCLSLWDWALVRFTLCNLLLRKLKLIKRILHMVPTMNSVLTICVTTWCFHCQRKNSVVWIMRLSMRSIRSWLMKRVHRWLFRGKVKILRSCMPRSITFRLNFVRKKKKKWPMVGISGLMKNSVQLKWLKWVLKLLSKNWLPWGYWQKARAFILLVT